MIISLAALMAGTLSIAVILLCLSQYLKKDPLLEWPAQVPPYFCEGTMYGRNHCSEAGLHQCKCCHREERRGEQVDLGYEPHSSPRIFNRSAE